MQIVIDIPNKAFENIVKNEYDYGDMNVIIQSGTPLPKGHGRLIDVKNIRVKPQYMQDVMGCAMIRCEDLARILANAPTIIEADREVEE